MDLDGRAAAGAWADRIDAQIAHDVYMDPNLKLFIDRVIVPALVDRVVNPVIPGPGSRLT